MTVDKQALKDKIREIHPGIDEHGLDLTVAFDRDKDAWYVNVAKGDNTMATYVENADAENCLNGVECVHLGMQIGRFIKNYCQTPEGCTTPQCH